ncbi:DUF3857 domain-containing transglutaminase family protein [Mucilaginibacter auburnensis]|uniref:Transglutaminase-like putative cysteine protease n=1 Tax=Mucilaginibacter auburnensis TaxID=1457233 RepID=A0A2H9VS79_9SPHI|nr:DUF3857 domain-containing transglutaminase family protein [Mucilaginibacter auburnensis]PJJ83674.1 transglutaminase-like putative cysteine protease [Mucilaginibacter auburnensis]
MKLTYKILSFLCFSAAAAWGQTMPIAPNLYKASTIPDSLKQDAHAVVRFSDTETIVKGPGKTEVAFHSIVTILDQKGDHHGDVALPYDKKFNQITDAKVLIYDANGKLIKKYSKSDFYDRAATDEQTLASNYRVLLLSHTISSYPTTVEIIWERSTNSYLDLGRWQYLPEETAVENAYYKVSAVPLVGFRYKNNNTNISPRTLKNGNYDVYEWDVHNLKTFKPEDDAIEWRVYPYVVFATNQFSFDGLPGDLTSWESYGKWYQALNAEGLDLSPQRAEEIRKMTADIVGDKAKAKFLYQYMQKNMHYVSIQLGIGGLKPFPAMFVDQKKYGDCKALSNYMVAMLKAVNIPAYYALIQGETNGEPADPLFPADPFNHIVVCVPFKGDTTWLECTSSTAIFGKLGSFTENRNALLITNKGGKLVNTPKSTCQDHQFNSEINVVLDEDGGAKAAINIKSTGEYRDMYLALAAKKVDDQKGYLINYLNLKQPSQFSFKEALDKDGVKELNIDLEYDKFTDVMSGDKRFYRPQVMSLFNATVPILEKRKTDFYFDHPMQKVCVTNIAVPAGFEVETLPTNTNIKFSYGSYDVSYAYDKEKNKIVSTAKFVLTSHVIPAAKYTEMQEYLDNIAKAQNKKLVIRKKA